MPPGGPCNRNNVCDLDEGCACSDCTNDGDNCRVGLTCKYNTENPILSSCQPDCDAGQVWNGTVCVQETDGVCGSANGKTFSKDDTGYGGVYKQCSVGDSSLEVFPSPGNTVRWVCR